MYIFTWATNPYDSENSYTNIEILNLLNDSNNFKIIRNITSRVGFGVVQYTYYVVNINSSEELTNKINELIAKINYIPFSVTSTETNNIEIQNLEKFVKHLVENVFKVKIETVETTKYLGYVSYRPYFKPEEYLEEEELLTPIFIKSSESGDLMLRCDPTPFRNYTYLNSHELTWLALSKIENSSNYKYFEKEGVIGFKGNSEDLIVEEVATLVEKYSDLNVKVYKVSELSLLNGDIIEELSKMYEFEILSKYPLNTRYVYYSFKKDNYFMNIEDAISEIKRESIPKLYFTGSWALSNYPIVYNRALFKYAALRAFAQIVEVNSALATSVIYVDVLPDFTVIAPLSNNKEAESFLKLLHQYSLLSRYWTFKGVLTPFEGLLKRWKIQIAYKSLTPLTIKVDNEYILVIDTGETIYNFIIPEVTEKDLSYLREELFKYNINCEYGLDAISSSELSGLSLEKLFELVQIPINKEQYCFDRDTLINKSTSIAPYNEKVSYNPIYPDFGFFGFFGLPLVGGLLHPINELPYNKPKEGNIEIEVDGDYKVVLIDKLYFIDIKTEKMSELKKVLQKVYMEGKIFNPWGSSYMLYKNKLSSFGLIGNKILSTSSDSFEKGDFAIEYMKNL